MSRRTDRLNSTIREAVQQIISRGLADPRIRGMVTVTRVEVSEDLRTAAVFVSVYPKEHEDLAMHGLKDATAHIRRGAGDLVSLPRMPQLRIKRDEGIGNQAAVFEALAKARDERVEEPDETAENHEEGGRVGETSEERES